MKILYIAHSSPRIHRRTAYSILSSLQVHGGQSPYPIALYTDNPSFYSPLAPYLEITSIAPFEIENWIHAAGGYRLAPKTEICSMQTDSFLFLDGDTVLLRPLPRLLGKLCSTTSIMQQFEYHLESRDVFASLVADPDFPDYTPRTCMYNSGMLGVHRDNLPVIRHARDIIFKIYARHHIHPADQLVVGNLLSQVSTIRTAPRYIYHYWQDKVFADAFMDRFFDGIGLAEMTRRVFAGDGAPLFALGFRRNPFLYDVYMRILPRFERLAEACKRHPPLS